MQLKASGIPSAQSPIFRRLSWGSIFCASSVLPGKVGLSMSTEVCVGPVLRSLQVWPFLTWGPVVDYVNLHDLRCRKCGSIVYAYIKASTIYLGHGQNSFYK